MYSLSNIKTNKELPISQVLEKALKKYKVKSEDLIFYKIIKKSLDARDKSNICWNYSFAVDLKNKYDLPIYNELHLEKLSNPNVKNPVIVGTGPAGLFCALTFIDAGITPILIEKGQCVDKRKESLNSFLNTKVLNSSSNIQFGEGGAGTFSDGKLNSNTNSKYTKYILDNFVKFGAPSEIAYLSKPHIGTDNLTIIVKNIREYIESKGGKYFFEEEFLDFKQLPDSINVITTNNVFNTKHLILATGHSSYTTYDLLKSKNISMTPKNFAIGVRIEHLAQDINIAQYGTSSTLNLPTADYKLAYHNLDTSRSCFTFCMCPGGFVMPSQSDQNTIVTNGMSNFARDNVNSNSALLVNITPKDYGNSIEGGIEFIHSFEKKAFNLAGANYCAPIMKVKNLIGNYASNVNSIVNPTYPWTKELDFKELFPPYILDTIKEGIIFFDKKLSGFANPNSILTAPETRTSSPVTINRNNLFQSSNKYIYPIGEGSGYAGGILTSAIDGTRAALSIIQNTK